MESEDKLDRIGLIGETEKGRNAELTKGRGGRWDPHKGLLLLNCFQ